MTIDLTKLREAAEQANYHRAHRLRISITDEDAPAAAVLVNYLEQTEPDTILALIERLEKAEADNAKLNSIINYAALQLSIWQGEHYDCDCPPHSDCGCKKLREIRLSLEYSNFTEDDAMALLQEDGKAGGVE